jgi:hypothetical protein
MSTRRELLLREFGVQPPARAWLRSCVQLWNRAAELPSSDPLNVAMRENASMQYRPKQLWCVGLESFLRRMYGYALPPEGLQAGDDWVRLPVSDVLTAFDEWWCRGFADAPSDPRAAPSSAVSLSTYEH